MADNSEKIALLTQLLQNGQISQDMFDSNLAKLETLRENLRPEMPARATSLGGVMDEIRSRGVGMQNIANDVKSATPGTSALSGRRAILESVGDISESIPKPTTTSLERLNTPKSTGRFSKTLKALGILGPAIGAMAMGDKAMAGDFGGAAMEGADMATDYIPVVGQLKDAVRPSDLGQEPTDPVSMKGSVFEDDYNKIYNDQARRAKGAAPAAEIEGLEDPVRYSDMENEITKRFNVLNRMK